MKRLRVQKENLWAVGGKLERIESVEKNVIACEAPGLPQNRDLNGHAFYP